MANQEKTEQKPMKEQIQRRVQAFGSFLSSMIMPNIGAFIAWGLITALFIPDGWLPNEELAKMVDPMIKFLIPLLIAFSGGRLVHDLRGGIVGATATMGIIAAFPDTPMLIGAMIMGPLVGWLMKKVDQFLQPRTPNGLEMLFNNFSAGFLAFFMTIFGFKILGPIVEGLMKILGAGVDFLVSHHLLPLVSIIIEPAKVVFLNNAINHGVLTPLASEQVSHAGRSILYTLESNPGPGLGILLAYMVFGKGTEKATSYGAAFIHFIGGIHEIYFPYVLARPLLILAAMAGGMTGVATFSLFNFGLTGPASPGSILAYFAVTPKGSYLVMLLSIFLSTLVTFIVASVILKFSSGSKTSLADATAKMEATKGKKSRVRDTFIQEDEKATTENTTTTTESSTATEQNDALAEEDPEALLDKYDTENVEAHDYSNIDHIIFACDAGMGSSAMGASMLRKKFQKAGIENVEVTNTAINQLPNESQLVITQKTLTDRAIKQVPNAIHLSVDNFLNSPRYEELIKNIKEKEHKE
ncbi:PTS mannitol transporter subunit IICB [Staphylococcus intermedius]|uniref:PTS system mannitol-specific EIICB component n=1 Tax=Staphylococcus intermedius NCTC 11048 TaxID=1141106 RepID=A0A380G732_STAIN|nr:PTS mannitol transporter subunit IICB [Staphylococcus intermedius]PCF62871.1 PTS mannitol transporter subunit IICB [Staphylococcus intermedius]PCF77983.1 PTS mannitol transporter subunit IICB [Staphylococcus intermedius]PCF78335.1 PTS mannitol transporter subunit IICB [Staphylococcus intermedius]PCF86131.1 PTS mannitol transporter subunit IICB [Staphylococcus intermedius]PNZ55362.1 PTS mannitol transporter subunit IICB [Staphylococcus intermedius NCTC 11048]